MICCPNNMKLAQLLVWFLLALPLAARSWTDTTGRTIEAGFLSADATHVTLMFKGKETKLPLSRLSEADRTWIEEESDSAIEDGASPTPTDGLAICGTPIEPGGPVVTVEADLTEETLKGFRKRSTQPSKLRMSVQLPADFDPAKPQRVMWVSAPINSDAERKAGNCAAIHGYANTATQAGWVVIAADTDQGNPRAEDNIKADRGDQALHQQAIDTLSAAWPGFKSSKFACCGFSGGAKATFFRVGQLLAGELDVVGMFIGGCNQDMTEAAREEVRFSKSKLRKIRVFVSNGKTDDISTVAHAESVKKSVDSSFGDVELHLFDGGHSINQEEFKKALDWFIAP